MAANTALVEVERATVEDLSTVEAEMATVAVAAEAEVAEVPVTEMATVAVAAGPEGQAAGIGIPLRRC